MEGQFQLLVSLVGDLGALGFVFWMSYRLTNHTIPRLAQQFEHATDRQREDFKQILGSQTEFFHREMEREREIHGQHVERIIEAIKDSRR